MNLTKSYKVLHCENQVIPARKQRRIQPGQVEAMGDLSRDQAYRLLRRLVGQGRLELMGRGRGAYYRLPAGKAGEGT